MHDNDTLGIRSMDISEMTSLKIIIRVLCAMVLSLLAVGSASAYVPARSHGLCRLGPAGRAMLQTVEWTYDGSYSGSSAVYTSGSEKSVGHVANLRDYNKGRSYRISLRFEHPDPFNDRAEISIFRMSGSNEYRVSFVEFVKIDGQYFVQVNSGYQAADCVVLNN